ncbi:4'-phosphopantetheinyl transferase superfamily protein [Streptomyces flavidovirens]
MRYTYLVTHVALRLALGKCLGLSPRGVSITRAPCPLCDGPHGRPVLPTAADLHFSLSHVRNTAMIAIARDPVGIDIEAADRVPADLLRRLRPNERAAVLRLPIAQRPAALLACWVRKEAYVKGLGTALGIPPHQADVGPGPTSGGCGTDKSTAWQLTTITAPPGYGAAGALQLPRCAQPANVVPPIVQRGCGTCELPEQRPLATAAIQCRRETLSRVAVRGRFALIPVVPDLVAEQRRSAADRGAWRLTGPWHRPGIQKRGEGRRAAGHATKNWVTTSGTIRGLSATPVAASVCGRSHRQVRGGRVRGWSSRFRASGRHRGCRGRR